MTSPTGMKSIPVARPSFGTEEETALLEALRSGWVSQGPRVAEFEERFAAYVGAPHAVAVSSCTAGLHLALVAAGVKPGEEVICPSLSFIATANSIVYAGAVPVFADIDKTTFNVDPQRIEAAITPRTKAVLVVHQIGLPAPLREILSLAERHGLTVIEDAACAIGSAYEGRRIGAPHSSMACFSFHPRKILTTGEGGMITTADGEVAARLRRLRQHAMDVSDLARHSARQLLVESYGEVGFNYRMTDLQAAVGLAQLKRLDQMLARRRELAARYTEQLSRFHWMALPSEPSGMRHNYQSYMVRLRADAPVSRNTLMQELLTRGVATRRGIMAIHQEMPYRSQRWDALLSATKEVTDTAIVLPLFDAMEEDEQDYVIHSIAEVAAECSAL